LLFDIDENELDASYSLFYEFHIEKPTYSSIRNQAGKLIHLTGSMDAWNQCQYSKFLRIVNAETLTMLRQCWLQYSKDKSLDATQRTEFIVGATKYAALKDSELAVLTPAFGPLALESIKPAITLAKEFWKSAAMERENEFLNPLFAYSRSNEKFSIHPKAHPLAGFHLASALVQLTSDSPYYQDSSPDDNEEAIIKRINALARLQFSTWCRSFQKYICSSSSLTIRFCVSDPTVLCFSLQQKLYPHQPNPLEFYPRAGTGTTFSLNDGQLPLSFNVVDTSDLIDSAGLFNILISVVPLLQQTVDTTLYTNTIFSRKDNKSETELLSYLLIEDIEIICSIFGIIPVNYMYPFGTEGSQHNVNTSNEYLNRIAWKVTLAHEGLIQRELVKPVFRPSHLVDILFGIYQGLFPYLNREQRCQPESGISYHKTQCTMRGFVMFLAFLKRSVIVSWPDVMEMFLKRLQLEEESQRVRYIRRFQLLVELHLFGLWREDPKFSNGIGPVHVGGVLRTLSPINYLVLTIPRDRLATFHRRFLQMDRHPRIGLEIAIVTAQSLPCVFSPTSIVFGNLVLRDGGKDCVIEPDVSGWDGSSNLYVCAYIPGFIFNGEDLSVQCLLLHDNCVQSLNDIETTLFQASLFDTVHVHLFEQLLTSIAPEASQLSCDTPAISDALVQIRYPQVNPVKTFSTRVIFLQPREKQLIEKGKIKILPKFRIQC
jgi:hypothetical protein